jgi:hypothetical protein
VRLSLSTARGSGKAHTNVQWHMTNGGKAKGGRNGHRG